MAESLGINLGIILFRNIVPMQRENCTRCKDEYKFRINNYLMFAHVQTNGLQFLFNHYPVQPVSLNLSGRMPVALKIASMILLAQSLIAFVKYIHPVLSNC